MKKYVLALDQGTTSSRAILFDKKGTEKWTQTDSLSYAECKTLRAYSYFNIAYLFSPSPKDEGGNATKMNGKMKHGTALFVYDLMKCRHKEHRSGRKFDSFFIIRNILFFLACESKFFLNMF